MGYIQSSLWLRVCYEAKNCVEEDWGSKTKSASPENSGNLGKYEKIKSWAFEIQRMRNENGWKIAQTFQEVGMEGDPG